MTIAQQLNITEFPFDIKNEEGRLIYTELSNGYWCKWEFDQDGNVIYTEDSDGYISYKRPKPEPEPVKKQTAVEWLYSELSKNHISNDSIESRIYKEMEIWKQAKAMEKERMEDAFMESRLTHPMSGFKHELFDDYFNETYGGDK